MTMKDSSKIRAHVAVTFVVAALLFFAASGNSQSGSPAVTIISPSTQSPIQTNLVSDVPGLAACATCTTDPNLINPWGIANSAASPYWISDQGTNKSTLYTGNGAKNNTVVTIPTTGTPTGPTGIVNVPAGATGFVVPGSSPAATAHFIFATLDGNIAAWAAGATATNAPNPITGAAYTGLALATNVSGTYLYAANFVNGGTIQIFNSTFASTTLPGSFTDPNAVAGYAPFNIQLIGSNLYVTYAEVGVPGGARSGAGLGYVDVFDTNGNFLQRIISNVPQLNAPWGITMAPAGFAFFPSDLLVGNFGNGEINAFNPTTGAFVGTISDSEGRPLVNNNLWAIEFGNLNAGSSPTTLYFTAGINGEQDGLFGAISPGPVSLTFPGLLVGATSAPQNVTIENTGNAPLNLTAAPTITGTNGSEFAIAPTGTTCTNGATIAPTGSCVISLTFTPGAAGTRGPATLTIADNASPSSQTVNLIGTGTNGAPAVAITPTSPLTFAGQLVTSTSTPQTVTVTNSGNASLTFGAQAISISDDFAQTNTCNGTTVAVNGTCTIMVTFTPASTTNNPRTGLLTIVDNAPNTPQTAALSGTGFDFSVTAPSTASVTRGTPGPITVTIGALGGFTGSVALSCTGTIPQGSCMVSTPSVTAPGTATVTVMTTALLQPPPTNGTPRMTIRQIVFLLLALTLLLSLPAVRRLRTRLSLVGAMLIFIALAGCSSSPSTPTGQYSLTVTGTSGGVSRSTGVTVTVN
jgi:uncharacterized protein (TIGR03118 family)